MVIQKLGRAFSNVFGSRNDRVLKRYRAKAEQINALEPSVRPLTDAQLKAKTAEFRQRVADGEKPADMLHEVLAVAREAMDRAVGIRNILNPDAAFDASRLKPHVRAMYDKAKAHAEALEPQPVQGGEAAPGWMQVELPVELYDNVRELYPESRPPFRARPFDVQLIGGMVLGNGKIAEMKTGEGKTIVAPLACYVAAVENLRCHVVTVNSYLVQRDRDWVFPFYHWLGLSVGAIHPQHMQPPHLKAAAYQCDAVYGTNSEFGFDYLRDNMKVRVEEQVQRRRDFCIIDEVDSILIDEARTPLIISGPAHEDAPRYEAADNVARHLMQKQQEWHDANARLEKVLVRIKGYEGDIRNSRDKDKIRTMREEMKRLIDVEAPRLEAERDRHVQYFEVEPERKAAHLTHEGVAEAQRVAGIGSFYVGNNMDFPHLLENALRGHAVYQRDKEYVVQNGEVIIVDEFTGRLMVGRQWSNGLHQAVEAKEKVKIKEETQTLATVTIQNFFKLYKRLAGMTGTAITEATEFMEIYRLDVISIPTNVPVIRHDREDLIFLSEKDKWNSIIDEIKRTHDLGRPVLVGTTSVEKSEMLSVMLNRKYAIQHEVLNAKQHEREAHIVESAGRLGAVMIATNMAGRGTDIKLQKFPREELIAHWQKRNLLPRNVDAGMEGAELVATSYRHQAQAELGLKNRDVESMSDEELKLKLLRHWCVTDAFVEADKAEAMSMDQCLETLDQLPEYGRHRMDVWPGIEAMGGLHIVGTERHESRRIDNQLRGRAGRQGDHGSSRFFISLEDDLMKMFAGEKTKYILSKLGMKEGDAIEHRMVSRSVERAQRKVEERNYEIRKNLLEYDEVMEHQRSQFYGTRQDVLEDRGVSDLIDAYIEDTVEDAVELYLAPGYVQTQVAEWCRETLDISLDPARIHTDDLDDLERVVRGNARGEVAHVIDITLGEYMSDDMSAEEWDLGGLSGWAESRFAVKLPVSRLREMNPREVRNELVEAAQAKVEAADLSGLAKFTQPHYAARQLAQWAREKFEIELDPEHLDAVEPARAMAEISVAARSAYAKREVVYPIEFQMQIAMQMAQSDMNAAIEHIVTWANARLDAAWTPDTLEGLEGLAIVDKLREEMEKWLAFDERGELKEGGRLDDHLDETLRKRPETPAIHKWLKERWGVTMPAEAIDKAQKEGGEEGLREMLRTRLRAAVREELTELEKFVLLQVLDQAWKDHLYAMDQLKDGIGLRGYAEKDPRIEYKREGASQFTQMRALVRDRVTDLIYRARLTPQVQMRSAYSDKQSTRHAPAPTSGSDDGDGSASATTARSGADRPRADRAASPDGEGEGGRAMTRKQRRAAAARSRKASKIGG